MTWKDHAVGLFMGLLPGLTYGASFVATQDALRRDNRKKGAAPLAVWGAVLAGLGGSLVYLASNFQAVVREGRTTLCDDVRFYMLGLALSVVIVLTLVAFQFEGFVMSAPGTGRSNRTLFRVSANGGFLCDVEGDLQLVDRDVPCPGSVFQFEGENNLRVVATGQARWLAAPEEKMLLTTDQDLAAKVEVEPGDNFLGAALRANDQRLSLVRRDIEWVNDDEPAVRWSLEADNLFARQIFVAIATALTGTAVVAGVAAWASRSRRRRRHKLL